MESKMKALVFVLLLTQGVIAAETQSRIVENYEPRPAAANDHRWGCCQACKKTWNRVRPHWTKIDAPAGKQTGKIRQSGVSVAVMCQDCWRKTAPHNRLKYYRQRWERVWKRVYNWRSIERAVLNGK